MRIALSAAEPRPQQDREGKHKMAGQPQQENAAGKPGAGPEQHRLAREAVAQAAMEMAPAAAPTPNAEVGAP